MLEGLGIFVLSIAPMLHYSVISYLRLATYEAVMEIALIGDRHTVYGFRLAGIRKTFLMEQIRQEDLRGILKGLFDDNIGIILVTEKVAEGIRDILVDVDRFRKGIMPIIVEIPDSGGPLPERIDPMRGLIKRTVGFEIA